MCGLFGIAGPGIIKEDLSVFVELGHVSQFRGTDGTGVFQTNTNRKNTSFYFKKDVNFNDWTYDNSRLKRNSLLEDVTCDFIMGHVRAATSGKIDEDNNACTHMRFAFN